MPEFDRAEAIAAANRYNGANRIIALMWAYQRDLEIQAFIYAEAKTEYGRRLGRIVIAKRMAGEKSAEVAGHHAEQDDDVFDAHLAYRKAEQMIVADREGLRVCHAELEWMRTTEANARAENTYMSPRTP
jgi:hypothetical protein